MNSDKGKVINLDDQLALKGLPNSHDAERAVLGALILENEAFEKIKIIISERDFYGENHRIIFSVISDMISEGRGVDLLTLKEEFGEGVEGVGGINYLASLIDAVPTARNIVTHAGIILEKSKRRHLIKIAHAVASRLMESDQALSEIHTLARNEFGAIDTIQVSIEPPKLFDVADAPDWPVEPLEWMVNDLIPKGGIGFLSGAPKDGKSLIAIDLCIHLAHGFSWLNHFSIGKAKTLYIAREDPQRRIKERITEINQSYGYPELPKDHLLFLIRDRFNLMDEVWIEWLRRKVEEHHFDFLILDVLNRMIPELDELSAKDMARMVTVLENLNRDLNLTILCIDHTRKPVGQKSERNGRDPNPFDLKGSVAKYGAADFMICLSRTEQEGQLQFYAENKDSDARPHFLVTVSPKDSGSSKFTYAGNIERFGNDRKALGDANRQKVLDSLGSTWLSPADINERCAASMGSTTVRDHLKALERQCKAERTGKGKGTMWRKSINATDKTHAVDMEVLTYDNDETL